jgi:hypothetical protein
MSIPFISRIASNGLDRAAPNRLAVPGYAADRGSQMKTDDLREAWLEDARADAKKENPLRGYCRRVYFQRTSCKRRSGPKKGKRRKHSSSEVELLHILPSGRCVTVKDLHTPGLDALAEEALAGYQIPPDKNPAQLFLDLFRKL